MKRLVEKEALEKIYETLRESWTFGATCNDPTKVAKAQEMVFDLIKNTPSCHNPVKIDALKEIYYTLLRSTAFSNEVEVVRMTKLVKYATQLLGDLLEVESEGKRGAFIITEVKE